MWTKLPPPDYESVDNQLDMCLLVAMYPYLGERVLTGGNAISPGGERNLTWGRRVPEAAEKSHDVGRRYRCNICVSH